MSTPMLVSIIGVGLLLVLVPLAILQRRNTTQFADAAGTGSMTSSDSLPPPTTAPAAGIVPKPAKSTGVGQIAVGVFIGLWLFTISAAMVGLVILALIARAQRQL